MTKITVERVDDGLQIHWRPSTFIGIILKRCGHFCSRRSWPVTARCCACAQRATCYICHD